MNQKSSTKAIFSMSIPIFVELLLQLLVGNVDQIMISQYSQESVAAIGNGNQIMNIVIIVLNVTSIATTILISQYLGAKNQEKITAVCHVSLVIIFFLSVFSTLLLTLGKIPILHWMKIPAEILPEAEKYLAVVALFILIQGFYINFAAILRSFGFMKEVMLVSAFMNCVNIGGNALLINGIFGFPQLGILGAAISTNISKTLGLCMIYWLFRKKVSISLSWKNLRPFPIQTLKNLLHIGIPSGGEELSYQFSQVYIMKFINLFGTTVIATKVYCSILANIAFVYSIALSQATQMAVSFLIGAGDVDSVKKRIKSTLWISMVLALSITSIFYVNSDRIFRIFTTDPDILKLGKTILFIEFFLEIGRSVNIVMTKCLIAVGDVIFPVTTGIIFMWSVAVGLSYLFGVQMGHGLIGIWIAMTIDESARGMVFLWRFYSGTWEKNVLTKENSLPNL